MSNILNRKQKRNIQRENTFTLRDLEKAKEEGIALGIDTATTTVILSMIVSLNKVQGFGPKRLTEIVKEATNIFTSIQSPEDIEKLRKEVESKYKISIQ